MKRRVGIVGIFLLLVALAALAYWRLPVQHWVAVHTGIESAGPDKYYNAWSGILSDIGEVTILTGILLAYRHHNCHVKGCPRLGKPVEGTPYVACPRHHPAHDGDKRGVAVEEIHRAFKERRK